MKTVRTSPRTRPAAPSRHEKALRRIVRKSTRDPRRDVRSAQGRGGE